MIRLVIADDHLMFRQGLRTLINAADDLSVVAECGRGDEALELVRLHRPDVLVLDISMPGLDGITVAARLARSGSETAVVILTTHDDPLMFDAALGAGARGYVLKDHAFEELLDTLRRVARGARAVAPREDAVHGARPVPLTDREREILALVGRGLTNRLIADALGISIKTVDNHRTNLMAKLHVHTTAELVHFAIKTGLA